MTSLRTHIIAAMACYSLFASGTDGLTMRDKTDRTSPSAHERIEIDMTARGNDISPSLYGIFFEEINHSGDGGLYGELIRNRSFEDTRIPNGWSVSGSRLVPRKTVHHFTGVAVDRSFPWPKSPIPGWRLETGEISSADISLCRDNPYYDTAPTSARLHITKSDSPTRLLNNGFWGIPLKSGEKYHLRTIIKSGKDYRRGIRAMLLDEDGTVIADKHLNVISDNTWNDISDTLVSSKTVRNATLALEFDGQGTIRIDYVSLFPENTFMKRPNGMRKDLAEMLAGMSPTFLRWPGGSIVGGITLDNRFDWKKTLGDPASRPGEYITWGERCSYGFGYHEMLQFCEDLGMDAMFVCNAGMADMFRSGEICNDNSLRFFIDDCLDAIEYAIGTTDTEWGKKRVAAGHPAPFPLKYVEVGNEHYGEAYEKRFDRFYEAIKERWPEISVVSNHFINGLGKSARTDIVDPHWYGTPNFYFNNTTLFDDMPRGKACAYIGEWACNFKVGRDNMRAALAEAAFLTGIERNADYVTMTSYAPLLQNRNDKDWNVNLIWFDGENTVGRASYYVQCMAAANKPDYNVAVDYSGAAKPMMHKKGKIGFGSSKSSVEIKNITISVGGATTTPDLKAGETRHGDWSISDDGVLRQTGSSGNSLYVLSGIESNDFVLECDVKRNSFNEGVFIFYSQTDNINEAVRYNVGGWNCELLTVNQLYDGLDVGAVGVSAKCSVMPGEWHHVKLIVTPDRSRLVLDGTVTLNFTPKSTPTQFVSAGVDSKTGELIVKVVNREAREYRPAIAINGPANMPHDSLVTTLAAEDDRDENSFESPEKIHPETASIHLDGNRFAYTFKPFSYTIMRIKTQ